jgi:nickel/cobalt transporter (NicO) family protein
VKRRARRLVAVGGLSAALFAALGLFAAPAALAHPLGNFTVNRYTDLDLSPGNVRVTYALDMAEIPTFQEMPRIDTDHDGAVSDAEKQAWGDRKAPEVLRQITLTVDGRPVALSMSSDSMIFRPGQAGLPILYFKATYTAALPSSAGSVSFADGNYGDRIGWKEITARSEDGIHVFDSTVPAASVSDELLSYPIDLLKSPLDVRQAAFSFRPGAATVASATDGGSRATGAPIASGGSFAALVRWRLTPLILGLSLLLAFAFGAVHALGPGHGKTITAAYLVGAGANRTQALAIGGAVSIMHTASVLLLGLFAYVLSKSFPADRVYPWLTLTTGLVALGLGTGLMVVRVRARRRGLDPWHGHSHTLEARSHPAARSASAASVSMEAPGPGSLMVLERQALTREHSGPGGHGHEHGPHDGHGHEAGPEGVDPVSSKGLLAIAVAGGILPSPTAFVVLTGSIYAHRVGYGLGLILAFSAGLAAALIAVGMMALRARAMVSRKLGGRVSGLIPIVSAAVIVGFGSFFALRGLGAAFRPSLALAFGVGIPAALAGVVLAGRTAHAAA